MKDLQSNQPKQRGGRRPGAGRKVKRIKSLARRCDKVTAAMILAVVDEQSRWLQFIESEDERVALDAMKFLTQMRDGRPKQPVDMNDARERPDSLSNLTNEELIARSRRLSDALQAQVG